MGIYISLRLYIYIYTFYLSSVLSIPRTLGSLYWLLKGPRRNREYIRCEPRSIRLLVFFDCPCLFFRGCFGTGFLLLFLWYLSSFEIRLKWDTVGLWCLFWHQGEIGTVFPNHLSDFKIGVLWYCSRVLWGLYHSFLVHPSVLKVGRPFIFLSGGIVTVICRSSWTWRRGLTVVTPLGGWWVTPPDLFSI